MPTLTIRTADGARHLATLEWRNGEVEAVDLADELAPALARWREQGVSEWVDRIRDGRHERIARVTTVADPNFLQRLADHLSGQFNFLTEVRELRNSIQTIALMRRTPAGLPIAEAHAAV